MAMSDETLTKRITNAAKELARVDTRIDRARATVENYDVDARALVERRDKAQEVVDTADALRAEASASYDYLATLARARGIEVPAPGTADADATAPAAEEEEGAGYLAPAGA